MSWVSAPVIYCLLGLSALLGITAGVQTVRLSSEKAAHATTKAKNAEEWTKQANLATRASELARKAEEANAAASLAAKDQLTEALNDGKARADSLAADLLLAKRQLHEFWTVPAPGSGGSEDSATLASRQEAEGLRAQAVADIAEIGAEADARETYLIQRYDSAVATCNGEHENGKERTSHLGRSIFPSPASELYFGWHGGHDQPESTGISGPETQDHGQPDHDG